MKVRNEVNIKKRKEVWEEMKHYLETGNLHPKKTSQLTDESNLIKKQ